METCFGTFSMECESKRKPKPIGRRALAKIELAAGKERAEQRDAKWSKHVFHALFPAYGTVTRNLPNQCSTGVFVTTIPGTPGPRSLVVGAASTFVQVTSP